jgi:Astacin (Peptidase family M12A)
MGSFEVQAQDAILEISKIASQFTRGAESEGNGQVDQAPGCRIMPVPERLWATAAEVAVRINPVNAPLYELPRSYASDVEEPMRLTIRTSKYWGPRPKKLSVSFMEATPADLRARIISHLNAWTQTAGISFAATSGTGEVRISRGPGGYYSYLGTDIRLIPQNRQTMNLQGFTMSTPDSEYRRVIRHEAGHTLGFPHEHMRKALVDRIDPVKAYAYFLRTQGWDQTTVNQQVLTPLEGSSIFGTEPDQDSIMCYQLPGEITYDGKPITGGADINATDYMFAGTIYPKVLLAPTDHKEGAGNDWDPAEDVKDISYE